MFEIPPKYSAPEIEQKWRDFWEINKTYNSVVNSGKKKYSVVIPPPNVTGILHIGHILNNTIQDIYCRWKRMLNYEVCWVPGMDHAGIATQIKVEEDLRGKGLSKNELGRDEFIRKVWEWKELYGGIILVQLRKLGVSVDWSRERFTLDEGLSKAVKHVFVDLYKKGLIYRGKRIVNWDSISQTALSDDEISYVEKNDKLYYIRYPIAGEDNFLIIATTRPETMLGDTAVAVNPSDERYNCLSGKSVILPLVNKIIPVVFDNYVDVEFGTGALKITPAHDANDFEVGKRHNLDIVNVLTKDGKINENGIEFEGLSVKSARKKILEKLEVLGFIEKIEDFTHNVNISERTGAVIEPYLSDQWFVSMKKLAIPAIKVVEEGKIKFHPDKWTKTYYYWLNNVRDWCISRQLWWGHQIPIWYHKNTNEIYCETEPPSDIENYNQDPDVLDTWFSSWLWPFSVFGWENSQKDAENADLKYFYPTDFLSTAPDIIFLWVARMIMSGLEYMKDIPFKDVYFHSTVRDGIGRKMSKSLGNSPDPLQIMDDYGTDALRFTIVYLAPLGSDVLFDTKNTEIGRNFITKLWNAGRFLMLTRNKIETSPESGNAGQDYDFVEQWIDSRYNTTLRDVEYYMNHYRLNDYTKSLYSFVWNDFCDWYIELTKGKINENASSAAAIINRALVMYENVLKLLHPVIPFVTEELWHLLSDERGSDSLSLADFPVTDGSKIADDIEINFGYFKDFTTTARNERAKFESVYNYEYDLIVRPLNISAGESLEVFSGTSSVLLNLKGKIILESAADINTDFEGTSGEYFAVQLKLA
ncbi:MAG: valine--tRNA ligase, partial [Ignavibacteriae bacterium]|nr:valine--tRNA ligase [Ignavibacteriota bacterium]